MLGYKNILVGAGAIVLTSTPALLISNTTLTHNKYNKTAHNIKERKN